MGQGILSMIKFLVGILLLPAIYALTVSFWMELENLGKLYPLICSGMLAYVIFYIFLFALKGVYDIGHKVFSEIFSFSEGLSLIVPLAFPVIPFLVLSILFLLTQFTTVRGIERYMVFLFGFTLAMHVVLSARTIYDADSNVIKAHYFFSMGLIYIANLLIIAALLGMSYSNFVFAEFFQRFREAGIAHYQFLYHKIPWPR